MMYQPTINEQKEYWDARWGKNSLPNQWQSRRGDTVFEFVRNLPLKRPKILDLGCATGWFTERLSHIGDPFGVDLSGEAISIAKSRYPTLNFLEGDIFSMTIRKGVFDVVVTQEVIAHVEDQETFIERISRVLKPGGYLVITSASKIVMERVDSSSDPREHIKKWLSKKELKKMLRPYFEILRTTTIIPMGNEGFLRIVNSEKLNSAIGRIVSRDSLESWKEKLGLGYSIIILAKKI